MRISMAPRYCIRLVVVGTPPPPSSSSSPSPAHPLRAHSACTERTESLKPRCMQPRLFLPMPSASRASRNGHRQVNVLATSSTTESATEGSDRRAAFCVVILLRALAAPARRLRGQPRAPRPSPRALPKRPPPPPPPPSAPAAPVRRMHCFSVHSTVHVRQAAADWIMRGSGAAVWRSSHWILNPITPVRLWAAPPPLIPCDLCFRVHAYTFAHAVLSFLQLDSDKVGVQVERGCRRVGGCGPHLKLSGMMALARVCGGVPSVDVGLQVAHARAQPFHLGVDLPDVPKQPEVALLLCAQLRHQRIHPRRACRVCHFHTSPNLL